MDTPSIPQTCLRCGKPSPSTYCDRCQRRLESDKRYRENNRQKIRERNRQWARNNPGTRKRWVNSNRDRVRFVQRRWAKNNPDKVKRSIKQHIAKNPDRFKERSRVKSAKWRNENRDKSRLTWHKRRTRKLSLPNTFTDHDWLKCLDYFNHRCAVCGSPAGLWHILAMDHWIPLNSPDCPGTISENIVPLCHSLKDGLGSCNASKSDRNPIEWLVDKFGKRQANVIVKRIESYFNSLKDKDK